jgi:cadmium resistance protein CadD (predicted permease)
LRDNPFVKMADNTFTLAMLSFFSTTVDDFCVILIFFAREYVKTYNISDPGTVLSFIKISIGQLIGFTIIVLVSLVLGIGLHSVVDSNYIDLIGLLPILLGAYKVYEIAIESACCSSLCCCFKYTAISGDTDDSNLDSKLPDSSKIEEGMGTQGTVYLAEEKEPTGLELVSIAVTNESSSFSDGTEDKSGGTMNSLEIEEPIDELEEVDDSSSLFLIVKRIFFFLDPLTFEVAVYALMFGTDNIAIYVALFSNVSLLETLAVCLFFYVMLLLYLVMALFIIIQVLYVSFECDRTC